MNRRRFCRMVGTGTLMMGLAVLSALPGLAQGLETGMPAPAFHLMSGDKKEISLDQVKGNVVVLFYETRDTVEQNRPFKNELKALLAQSESVKAATTVLAVINCSSAVWPITKIWQAKLCENSEKEQLTVYGDWDGKMAADYGMKADAGNILIMDSKGVLRYRRSGVMTRGDISAALDLLKQWSRRALTPERDEGVPAPEETDWNRKAAHD